LPEAVYVPMNLRKAGLWSGGILVFLLLAAVVAVKVMIDPQRLKEVVREKVRKHWARELTLSDLKLEFSPLPSLHAVDVTLAGKDEPAIRAAQLIADLELVPLLLGEARYRTIYVKDATIERGGSTWRVEEGTVESGPDLHDVKIAASLWRNRKPVSLVAQFDDLSKLGERGESTTGRIELEWNQAKLVAAGRMPVDGTIARHAIQVELSAESIRDLCDFFGIERRPTAPFNAKFDARENEGRIEISNLDIALGRAHVRGQATYAPATKPVIDAKLAFGRVDWAQAYLDAGGKHPRPKGEETFRDTPLAWWALTGLEGFKGTVDATFETLILRNGIELTKLATRSSFDGDRWDMTSFDTQMLGGTAKGAIHLLGSKKSARFDFDGTGLLMERWIQERGGKAPVTGGPMTVKARLSSSGESFHDLVGSMSGPFDIRMGRAVLASAHAGELEAKLTTTFSGREADRVEFECASFALPFRNGRAQGSHLVGARTTVSTLLTGGVVDMRQEQVDLRGRMKGKRGVGLAAIMGDVKITGPVKKPKMHLDETAAPKAVARGALAVATLGLSALGTAAADAEEGRRNDPCEAVFR
jgi:hypothetical protein